MLGGRSRRSNLLALTLIGAQERTLSKRIPERWADHCQDDASDALGIIFKAFLARGDPSTKELPEGETLEASGGVVD